MENTDALTCLSIHQRDIYQREKQIAINEAKYYGYTYYVVLEPCGVIFATEYRCKTDVTLFTATETSYE